jgi:hypothetical protein
MYIKLTNGTPTEYTIGQLRRDNPNVSFPKKIPTEILAAFDVYPAVVADVPDYIERTQAVTQDATPTQIDGVWTYGWTVSDKSSDEVQEYDDFKASNVRIKRDNLLAETDYLALSDNTLSAAMTTYRQALRDITSHANFPYLEEADWPVKP